MSGVLRQLRPNLLLTLLMCLGLAAAVGFGANAQQPKITRTVDSSSYDYWTQIVEHQIPEVRDGAARYFPGGRYYIGPNGLEIRFTSRATQIVVGASMATGGYTVAADALIWVAQNTTPMVVAVLKNTPALIKAAASGGAGAALSSYIPGNLCLGMTLPSRWVVDYLNGFWNNLNAFGSGQIPLGYGYNMPVWLESCS